MGLNQVSLSGNLVTKPTVRQITNDNTVCNFRLANDRNFRTANGPQKETVFIDCEAFGGTAKLMENLDKGDKVLVVGTLRMDSWQGEDGKNRSKLKIGVREFYSLAQRSQNGTTED